MRRVEATRATTPWRAIWGVHPNTLAEWIRRDDSLHAGDANTMAATDPNATHAVTPERNVDALDLVVDGALGYFAVADAVEKPAYHGRIVQLAIDGSGAKDLLDVGADTLVSNVRTSPDAIYFTTLAGVEETIGTVRKICK